MKRILSHVALVLALALCASSAALAKTKHPKYSPEHNAATKKCKNDYIAAIKASLSLKGKERAEVRAKAKADKRECIASAPK
ncbi:MAG: hypothetical protein DMF68_09895 [Acidobacteria bacterium]|nr:MAG: hypothetical protein DMF68_09895 [Acidobacteriota bacterium]